MCDNKSINISGTANKYQIKKLTKLSATPICIRKETNNWSGSEEELSQQQAEQLNIIRLAKDNSDIIKQYPLFFSQIERKINSYKHQDIDKKVLCLEKFVTITDVIEQLDKATLCCHYCYDPLFVLYKIVREMKQWTLDRINNDLGHNNDNIVISCLKCNLSRRRTNKDAFLFTKQLKLIKHTGVPPSA